MNRIDSKRIIPIVVFTLAMVAGSWAGGYQRQVMARQIATNQKADVNFWLKELKKRDPRAMLVAKSNGTIQVTGKEPSSRANTAKVTKVSKGKEEQQGPKRISVDFYKVDLHNVFRLLGKVSGKNVVVDEGVKGTLTLALDNVPWTFVLEVIKNLKDLDSIERNNTIMIYPKKKSIQWAGEDSSNGNLETQPVRIEISKIKARPNLAVKQKHRSKTPLKDIVKAEKLIKKAAKQERTGNILGAYETLKKAAKLWPDNLKLNEKLAALALQMNDNLTAFNYGKQALKLNSRDAEAAAIAAVALARMDRPGDAREYFEMAMDIKPTRDILWNYAVFSFSQGNYRQALRLINRIEANYNITPDLIMLKAQCYEYLSKIRQAIAEYRSILSAGNNVSPEMVKFAKLRLTALTGSVPTSNN